MNDSVSRGGDKSVSVLLGNGDGTFEPKQVYLTGEPSAFRVAVGDVNGDGNVDIATTMSTAASIAVFIGNGDGSFKPVQGLPTGPSPWGIEINDLNLDGIGDITVSSQGGLFVFLGGGGGGVYDVSTYGSGHTIADVNRDDRLDVLVMNTTDGTMDVLFGNGDGSFRPGRRTAVPQDSQNPVAADFNRDRKMDVALISLSGSFALLMGNGDGTFQPAIIHPMRFSDGMAAADLDGDRYPEAIVPSWNKNTVWVYKNDGNWTIPLPMQSSVVSTGIAMRRSLREYNASAIGIAHEVTVTAFESSNKPPLTRRMSSDPIAPSACIFANRRPAELGRGIPDTFFIAFDVIKVSLREPFR
jgi:hypothetical protein